MDFIFFLVVIAAILIGLTKIIVRIIEFRPGINVSVYERKPYLFDSAAEFNLYKVLLELFGNQYFIFPQVNYSHLIRPKKAYWTEERRHRSRIDRKSADFVFCDKQTVVPKLIIELDGPTHNFQGKQRRDEFIDELTKVVDLPILHLRVGDLDREFIRGEIDRKLNESKA